MTFGEPFSITPGVKKPSSWSWVFLLSFRGSLELEGEVIQVV